MARSKQILALANLNLGTRRPKTPAQSRQMQNFAALGQAWQTLSPAQRTPWQLLANQMNHETGLRTPAGLKQKRPLTAFLAFTAVNTARQSTGRPLTTLAPDAVTPPAPLPPVLLTATADPSRSDPGALPFTLTLHIAGFADSPQIFAAAPRLAGQYPAAHNAVIIAVHTGPLSSPIDLAPAYSARFGPLQSGHQVVLTLVPFNSLGFKGTPLAVAADVTAQSTVKRLPETPRALQAA